MNAVNAIRDYFTGVIAELRRVVWPTMPTLGMYFLSVVVGITLITALVGGVDYVFIKALGLIIK